jgi:hypothetical protein
MAGSAGESLRAALVALAAEAPPALGSRLYALGWATVELDRAERELTADLGLGVAAFIEAPDSGVLGARCRVSLGAFPGGVALVILEPATEGRLSAALARYGEAPLAVWFVLHADTAGVGPSSTVRGPFGPERIAPDGSVNGLRRLLVDLEAGTIPA